MANMGPESPTAHSRPPGKRREKPDHAPPGGPSVQKNSSENQEMTGVYVSSVSPKPVHLCCLYSSGQRERHVGAIYHKAYGGYLDEGCGVIFLFGIFSSVLKEAHFYKFKKDF